MKKHIRRDLKRRNLFAQNELRRRILKSIIYSTRRSPSTLRESEDQLKAQLLLTKLSRDSSKVRIRNRCTLTARPRGVLRAYRVSRIVFREFASRGLLPGVRKSSW